MKRYLIILLVLFIPVIVNAETCDTSKVYIDSISVDGTTTVEELSPAIVEDKTINLNLGMNDVGDNIKYKINIKNDSNEDYEIDNNSINLNSEYINYSIESNDNSNIVKAKNNKTMYLNVQYKKEIPDDAYTRGVFNDNLTMKMNLSTKDELLNPNTGKKYLMIIILILSISGILLFIFIKNKSFKVLIILSLILIPISAKALCKCELFVNCNINIDKRTYIYSYYSPQYLGQEFNAPIAFDNLDDALTAFGHDYLIRHTIFNNTIVDLDIVFKIDDNIYYLNGSDDTISYETKKNQIANIFGNNNCEEGISSWDNISKYYSCTNGNLTVRTCEEDPPATITDANYYCIIFKNGKTMCFND